MSTVRVRKKSQITLPAKASAALGIAENDLLEVEITGQMIILRPRRGEAAESGPITAIRGHWNGFECRP